MDSLARYGLFDQNRDAAEFKAKVAGDLFKKYNINKKRLKIQEKLIYLSDSPKDTHKKNLLRLADLGYQQLGQNIIRDVSNSVDYVAPNGRRVIGGRLGVAAFALDYDPNKFRKRINSFAKNNARNYLQDKSLRFNVIKGFKIPNKKRKRNYRKR
jgi:hypothetical protein